MKLNPFKFDFMKDVFVFHEKNDFIFLKIYIINNASDLGKITSFANEKMILFQEIHYCLNIHYDGVQKTCYLSVSAKWNGDFYKIDAVERIFGQMDAELGEHVGVSLVPSQQLYYTPFHGVNNFLLKIDGNKISLHDPASRELLQQAGMFEINLHNIEIFPTFFKLIDDLALKMKIKIDVNVLFRYENNRVYMEALFTFIENRVHRFNEILEKLSSTNEFNVMLKKVEIQKRDIARLFVKRMIGDTARYTTIDGLKFFSTYLFDSPINTCPVPASSTPSETVPVETGSASPPVPKKAIDAKPVISTCPLSNETIAGVSKDAFHAAIKRECSGGAFLDREQLLFDDGSRILAAVHALSVKGLYQVIKEHVSDRRFKLFFVDRNEMAEFNRRLGSSLENVCEAVPLPETMIDDDSPWSPAI